MQGNQWLAAVARTVPGAGLPTEAGLNGEFLSAGGIAGHSERKPESSTRGSTS
jgi:hypothetical protein